MLHCVNTSEFSTCYLRNAVLGKSGASAHRFPHPHASLYVKGRIPQYITVNTDCARFKQQDYGGAPKGKVSLFLAAENIQSGICLMMVHDSANHHGAAGSGYQRINVACPRKTLADALDRFYQAARKRGMAR